MTERIITDHNGRKHITTEPLLHPPQRTAEERNFCPRCGKRLGKNDWDIHTCTPPMEKNNA